MKPDHLRDCAMEEIDVDSWEEFENRLKELRLSQNPPSQYRGPLLFRGQSDSRWPLRTTLEQSNKYGLLFSEYYRIISNIKPAIETLIPHQWIIPEYLAVKK